MAASRPYADGRRPMIYVGRAIGLFVLCVLVGLFLESIGITAGGIFHDTWHTIGSLAGKLAELAAWSLPYALVGAIVVVPLMLLRLVESRRRRKP
jgi:ABC-type Fe3+ transport system permease subunit